MTDSENSKRVTVIFSQDQLEKLEDIAKIRGTSVADALREVLDVGSLVTKARANKTKILFKRGNDIQELAS
jgi:hypothetical protein